MDDINQNLLRMLELASCSATLPARIGPWHDPIDARGVRPRFLVYQQVGQVAVAIGQRPGDALGIIESQIVTLDHLDEFRAARGVPPAWREHVRAIDSGQMPTLRPPGLWMRVYHSRARSILLAHFCRIRDCPIGGLHLAGYGIGAAEVQALACILYAIGLGDRIGRRLAIGPLAATDTEGAQWLGEQAPADVILHEGDGRRAADDGICHEAHRILTDGNLRAATPRDWVDEQQAGRRRQTDLAVYVSALKRAEGI